MSSISKYINLTIAGRTYRIKTSDNEEAIVWKACQQIQAKLEEYKTSYRAKDRQDYLAMVALTLAVDSLKREEDISSMDLLEQELDKTDQMIEKYLDAIQK